MGGGISVRGGSDGIDARCDDLVAVAGLFGRAATDTAAVSWSLQRYLFDPGTFGSALLDPAGAAAYEFDLARALDGPHGVTRLAVECAAVAVRLRTAAQAYRVADHLDATAHTVLDGLVGLPAAAIVAGSTLASTGSPVRAVDELIAVDPGLADEAAAMGIAAASALPIPLRGLALRDGHPDVRSLGPDTGGPAIHPPRDVADLMSGLAARNRGAPGEIDVRILQRPNGRRAVVVDIPGTKSWTPLPTDDVTSMVTNARAISGRSTSYERGVFDALHAAGVTPTDDILMIGHSEGGMVAVQAAITAEHTGAFRVTHVITAGSPIGRTVGHLPRSISVLALENADDIVPRLDAAPNPPAPNVTTVTVDHDEGQVLANHEIESAYLPAARDVDASRDPSIRDFVSGAAAFLDAREVTTHRFLVRRSY